MVKNVFRLPRKEKSHDSINPSEISSGQSAANAKVTDEELIQVLSLMQVTSGVVFLFICSLGLLAIYFEKRHSFNDKIPGPDLILYKFAESLISTISGILVKFGPTISENCCNSTKPVPVLRVIAISIDIILLVMASISLFWPSKSYMSPVTLAAIYIIEVIFYSTLIFILFRLIASGGLVNYKKVDKDVPSTVHSSA